jgi:hypothetical protein
LSICFIHIEKLQRRGEKIGSLPGVEPGYTVG